MRAVVQRVTEARVRVVDPATSAVTPRVGAPEVTGEIGAGLLVLLGVTHSDTSASAAKMAAKLWQLRIMPDDEGVMNRAVADTTRALLVVSQFTLYGDTTRGRRPSWTAAAPPEQAEPLVQAVIDELVSLGASVAVGRFRSHMVVELVNDGPVTVLLDVD